MSVRLSPYPEYKDSGLEWLGEIPAHWRMSSLRQMARVQLSNVDKHTLEGEVPVKLCNYTDVYYRGTITSDIEFMKASALPREIGKFELKAGDVMITKDSESWTDIAVPAYVPANLPGVLCGYHLAHIRPNPGVIEGSYLFRAFESETLNRQFRVAANGVTRFGISKPDIAAGVFLLPPLEEQRQISRYLDRLDSLASRLIQTKQQLIELLKEQKQAIIHNAVTRGLDPDAPMKSIGLDWMPEVPEHWPIAPLRMRYSTELGKMLDAKRITGDYLVPYLRNIDVQWDRVNTTDLPTMDIEAHEYERYTLKPGDMLVCEGGEVGRSAFWNNEISICGFQKALHRVRVLNSERDSPRYLYYLMYTAAKIGLFVADGSENTIAHLTGEKLRAHRFPFPPKTEQEEIARHLDETTRDIEKTIERARSEIDLIGEYRTRLVSDVVTGKLDVRGVELPEVEEIEGVSGIEESLPPILDEVAEESHTAS